MKTLIIVLMICVTSLSSYNPVKKPPYICFSTNEATDIIKKLKLYHIQSNIIADQEKMLTVFSNTLALSELARAKAEMQSRNKVIIFSTISAAVGFIASLLITK